MRNDLFSALKTTLNVCLENVSNSHAAFIATLDGHLLLESQREKNAFPCDAISPMAGSLLGISDTIAEQLMNQRLDDAIIMMENKAIALLKIHDKEDSLYLGLISNRNVNLGMLLTMGNQTIEKINKLLEENVSAD